MDKTVSKGQFIGGEWMPGEGQILNSMDPARQEVIWNGHQASRAQVATAFQAARAAFDSWPRTPLPERIRYVEAFGKLALEARSGMSLLIARETGKVLWDATGEGAALSAKVDISLTSYHDRTGVQTRDTVFGRAALHHRAHGVMAILGPYNFPAHLPSGQIIPALIAGNTVVFKPSEQCPAVGEALTDLYSRAGFPDGVINMVQGARDVGAAVLGDPEVNGVLFTGSAKTGARIHKLFGGRPDIVLALEMGGNNPLIIRDVEDVRSAASLAVQSAFVTTGQRCTCTRRLILPEGGDGDALLAELLVQTEKLILGSWEDGENASTGPVVCVEFADFVVKSANALVEKGAKEIKPAQISAKGPAYVEPGIYDVTGCDVPDEEIFGPVLQIVRAGTWNDAIRVANNTKFGLAAGLVSDDAELWEDFRVRIRAGIVNFNRPTTGAVGFLPFGGVGVSGNHRPGAYYTADFCAWPMASQIADRPEFMPLRGVG
ncbi:MAG: succinylglutamate-semialdehyde dehydrogenase [Hyphomonadaceae bacterium]|nr:succinylglutamate-semialdehyde dehydrogenase [Hyphomonadaceae bacterium]MBC6411707.1 succinylglutamate-semialdehyde dehydrogenase [Hyphomonadaceae bacterium]